MARAELVRSRHRVQGNRPPLDWEPRAVDRAHAPWRFHGAAVPQPSPSHRGTSSRGLRGAVQQTVSPNALWHGDVCHLTGCTIAGKPTPIRIHGMLDDASKMVQRLYKLLETA